MFDDSPANEGSALRQFAEERSHRDAQASNENVRATAQTCILINGGAATAILAFAAKGPPAEIDTVSWCLMGYAIGVVAAASMMFSMMRYTDWYHYYWRLIAHPEVGKNPQAIRKLARRYLRITSVSFLISVTCFVLSTAVTAIALHRISVGTH